jgi:hypothetical protein
MRPFWIPRRRQEDDIKMHWKEIGFDHVDWINSFRTGFSGYLFEHNNETSVSVKDGIFF